MERFVWNKTSQTSRINLPPTEQVNRPFFATLSAFRLSANFHRSLQDNREKVEARGVEPVQTHTNLTTSCAPSEKNAFAHHIWEYGSG
jgi:hypothetical protein